MTGSTISSEIGTEEALTAWGEAVDSRSEAIVRSMGDLQGDLSAFVTDIRSGPVSAFHDTVKSYLESLRLEFLRHHRRLVVRAREDESAVDRREHLRGELAELVDRFRGIVLTRSSRVSREVWSPAAMLDGLERIAMSIPVVVHAPFEEGTYAAQPDDGFFRAVTRAFLRFDRWLRRRISESDPKRRIELAELARYHVVGTMLEELEGVAALFVEADAQLVGQSRVLLDGVVRGYETLLDAADMEGDPYDALTQFRASIEEEFAGTEEHVLSVLNDGAERAEKILQEGLREMKADLPIVSTFELPARRRRSSYRLRKEEEVVEELENQLARLRDAMGASYVLLALHLELRSFRAKVMVGLEQRIRDLVQDVRGRSVTQLERVEGGVEQAIDALSMNDSEQEEQEKETVEFLERLVTEAIRAGHQLQEQLEAEDLAAPFLEILNREALTLTDRYRVPVDEVGRGEFHLPPAPDVAEVSFSEVVSNFVQRDIAPRLLDLLSGTGERLGTLLSALDNLERLVTFEADASRDELDARRASDGPEGSGRLVLKEGLARNHEGLRALREEFAPWPEELGDSIRSVVVGRLETLRNELSAGSIADFSGDRVASGPGFGERVGRLTRVLNELGEESTSRVRRLVGEERIREFTRQLNLTTPVDASPDVGALLSPPEPRVELPIYYRRLFAPHAHWAGDLLPGQEELVSRVLDDLTPRAGVGLRAACILSSDGSGRSPLFTKVVRRHRGNVVKRWIWSSPVSVKRVNGLFSEVGSGQLVLVGGFSYLFSAKPGGFDPLMRFLEHLTEGAGHNAYLVETSELSWKFAASVAPLDSVFGVVRTVPLSAREIERAVYARHELSGWEVLVRDDSELSDQPEHRQQFFDRLHARSFGSLSLALSLWLAAIESAHEERRRIILGDLPASPEPAFHELDDVQLMTLYLTQRQGWMDAESLGATILVDKTEAVGWLSILGKRGFLDRETGGIFVVARHLRPVVLKVLRERGWVS